MAQEILRSNMLLRCLLLFLAATVPYGGASRPKTVADARPLHTVWPMPQSITCEKVASPRLLARSAFSITSTAKSDTLTDAMARYMDIIFPSGQPPVSTTSYMVTIDVKDPSATLGLDTDDSYDLTVDANNAVINASTVFGAMYGLETFSQLTFTYGTRSAQLKARCKISDFARFPHRGVMLDVSRNFLPEQVILRTITAMSYNKLNVLHWHLSDSQSFPFVSQHYPGMSKTGAYSSEMVYTPDAVARIVKQGQLHGVRVVPEFDVPGHVYAGYAGYNGSSSATNDDGGITVCGDHEPWTETCVEPPCGQLDVTNPMAVEVYANLMADVAAAFPDAYVHTGGDEVKYTCWNSSASVRDYVQSKYGDLSKTSYVRLWDSFQRSMNNITAHLGRTPIQWEGAFNEGLQMTPNSIVQAWLGPATIKAATAAGQRVVVSDYHYWYLDCGAGNWVTGGKSWCAPFKSWMSIYDHDPTAGLGLTPAQEKLVLGGEVCLWSEQVDEGNVYSKLWPRASGVAERLWSNRSNSNWMKANHRLLIQSERMRIRGIPQAAQAPRWCLSHPGECLTPTAGGAPNNQMPTDPRPPSLLLSDKQRPSSSDQSWQNAANKESFESLFELNHKNLHARS